MPPRVKSPARPVLFIVATALAALVVTAAVSIARLVPGAAEERPTLGVVRIDDLHEGQLEVAAAMVLTLIAAVLWARVRRRPTRRHLMLFMALCMLAVDNLLSALLTASFDSISTNRFATWTATVNGLAGAVLLAAAAWLPDEPLRRLRQTLIRTFVGAAVGFGVMTLLVWTFRDRLPATFETRPEAVGDATFLSDHPSLYLLEILTAGCWAMAAVLFTQVARRSEDELTWWLAAASVLATASSVNYALFPSHFTELLYLGDYFFLLAVSALLVGSVREVGVAEAALVDRALYDERRRIAREMHDGVAQEIAIVSAQAHRIQSHPESTDVGLQRIQESADRAMDEARTAIRQLRGPFDESLAAQIGLTAETIAEREGIRLELDLDESVEVEPDVRLALVRVTRDAVGAAVRQARAGTVRIDLHQDGLTILRISDDVAWTMEIPGANTTMTSIRERLGRINGELAIRSNSDGGTTWEVTVP
ncbi:sensor histidine kinase [Nocardioides bizhenqiangii]|uniref:histidine kinase n=1 Tax=Nocardioides bizhenqiangii TaxID=3095076 RepID=A0ABZ0ZWS8_9ACTN|nr:MULTISPECIES: histidine kinase [unclassified Nocardioides]MDZ5622520.1 histidine kinase [Nocardioides sp. HM23]WQQ28321.1 histidine kinase [Nocardioides sp. HM61]